MRPSFIKTAAAATSARPGPVDTIGHTVSPSEAVAHVCPRRGNNLLAVGEVRQQERTHALCADEAETQRRRGLRGGQEFEETTEDVPRVKRQTKEPRGRAANSAVMAASFGQHQRGEREHTGVPEDAVRQEAVSSFSVPPPRATGCVTHYKADGAVIDDRSTSPTPPPVCHL